MSQVSKYSFLYTKSVHILGWMLLSFSLLLSSCKTISTAQQSQNELKLKVEELITTKRRLDEQRHVLIGNYQLKLSGLLGMLPSMPLDLMLESPNRFRLEIRSFIETPMEMFASDGHSIEIYDTFREGKGKFYKVPATKEALAQFLPIDLSPQDFVNLALGKLPDFNKILNIVETAEEFIVTVQRNSEQEKTQLFLILNLQKPKSKGKEMLILKMQVCSRIENNNQPKSKNLKKCQVEIKNTDFKDLKGQLYPHTISIKSTYQDQDKKKQTRGFELKAYQLNIPEHPFAESSFHINVPEGSQFENL